MSTTELNERMISLAESAHAHEIRLRDIRIKQMEELNRILAKRIDEMEAEKKK